VRLVSLIAKILKKCLAAEPSRRYECCSDLLADLQKAVDRIKRYTMTAAEEKPRTDPAIIMQKLLYEHPLYECMADGEQDINVLVVGAGTYGQKFIDICLQAGQMKDRKLRIRAVSNSPEEDAELYLQFRPAMKDFVDVKVDKDQLSKPDYSCGSLHFAPVGTDAKTGTHLAFTRGDNEINARIVDKILEDARNSRMRYNYVFVALGSDRLNQSVAKLFVEGRAKCPVCYVSEKTKRATKEAREKKLFPVCVNEPVTPETIESSMDQMAFNTHIAWNSSMNIDVSDTCRRFLADKYSYSSSMAFVLSIKYKLHSVGIELGDDYLEAARRFSEEILDIRETDEKAGEKFSALVALEHRRWLLSYITAGWTAPLDKAGNMNYAECAALGREKDPVKRTHVCIVPSGEEMPLMSEEYTRDNRAKWDSSELDLSLDPLDRLSVMLHREYRRAAEEFRRARPLMSEDIKSIERAIAGESEQTVRAFRQFRFCLKNILAGVESYSRQYGYYLNEFTRTLSDMDSGARSAIDDRLNMITKGFRCVIESNLYRDYKANDAVLIRRIPFILTYRMPASMAMAFEDGRYQNGRNEAVFANVASATLLSPPKICYVYNYNEDSAPDMFVRKLGNVINYLDKRNVHTEISLIIAWRLGDTTARTDVQERLHRLSEENFSAGGNAIFSDFCFIDCSDENDAAARIAEALKERGIGIYDGSTGLFSSHLNNGVLVGRLLDNGVSYFEFDWKRKQFNQRRRCEYLKYIEDDSYIRINDMFALMNAVDNRSGLPEFAEDYETLWDIYTGKYMDEPDYEGAVGSWNRLCGMLSAYEDKRPPLTLIVTPGKDEPRRTYTQFMPEFTFRKLEYIVGRLIKLGIIGEDSCVTGYTSDTCRLDVTATYPVWAKLSQALARHDMLLDYYDLTVNKYQNHNSEYVKLICNDTQVKDIDLDGEEKGRFGPSIKILEQLQSAGFISRLTQNPQRPELVSFTYSSHRIKKLLTSEGEILEVFIYYELLKSGYFDDVACGYEFRWEEGGVKNELDCVVVKGFRTMIIECKATHTLKLEYYHKLHSIAEHFGIGSTKVLVGNTYRKSNVQTNRNNDMQRSRGSQLNIITISEKEEIENIGLTLRRIMEAH